jgi:hypothetical protein
MHIKLLIFYLKVKGNLLFKLPKTDISGLSQNKWLIDFKGAASANN